MQSLRLAEDGEKAVGQHLEALRAEGYSVFHDLIGDGFNVDHVIVGPAGVFTIETKAWSKPAKGSAEITFDGESLLAAGREPERNPVVQAKAQANWLRQILAESTGKPIRCLAGGAVPRLVREEQSRELQGPVGAGTESLHQVSCQRESKVERPEDISLASFHLSQFIPRRRNGDFRVEARLVACSQTCYICSKSENTEIDFPSPLSARQFAFGRPG